MDNPFTRFHENIEKYPGFLDDIDDFIMTETDEYERFKHFKGHAKKVVGTTTAVPTDDDDSAFKWNALTGDNLYSNPPSSNTPFIDHGLEEDHVWAWRKDLLNQKIIENDLFANPWSATEKLAAPFWAAKLCGPHFYTEEKFQKMMMQWRWRQDFEILKMQQAIELRPGDKQQQAEHHEQIQKFMARVEGLKMEENLKDVYVTNHKQHGNQ